MESTPAVCVDVTSTDLNCRNVTYLTINDVYVDKAPTSLLYIVPLMLRYAMHTARTAFVAILRHLPKAFHFHDLRSFSLYIFMRLPPDNVGEGIASMFSGCPSTAFVRSFLRSFVLSSVRLNHMKKTKSRSRVNEC